MYKKSVLIFLFSTLTLTLLAGVLNYVIDPYGKNLRFTFKLNERKAVRDERIYKFDLLHAHPEARSFLFGSSRALYLDPVQFAELTGTKTLNLGFSSGFIEEHILYIKYLIETHDVRHIMIGIDLFSFAEGFHSNGTLPQQLRDHFGLDNDYPLYNYLTYSMLKLSFKTIRHNLKSASNPYDKYTSLGQVKTRPDKSPEALRQRIREKVIEHPARWDTKFDRLDRNKLTLLAEVKALCDAKGIQLHLFTSPLYIKQIRMKHNKFSLQKKLVAYIAKHISPIWDYNGVTAVNTDPYAYDDEFHYNAKTAYSIMQEVLTGTPAVPEYRGTLVNATNVDAYLGRIPE